MLWLIFTGVVFSVFGFIAGYIFGQVVAASAVNESLTKPLLRIVPESAKQPK